MIKSIENVRYFGYGSASGVKHTACMELIGLDTEAYTSGKCFLICTSEGDAFKVEDFPGCLFSRKYRGKKFSTWNLKYDEGALLQFLDEENLHELWEKGFVEQNGWSVRSIPQKMLSIRRKSHSITVYDMYQFYAMSLDAAAEKYLGERKMEMETKSFTPEYVRRNGDLLIRYCVRDADLCKRLSDRMIKVFNVFGVNPSKLYSTAYVSYQYFKSHCHYPTVKKFWDDDRKLLEYSMSAYRGGKFEVTRKGVDNYYEYDIVSAYPFEIANLIDTTYSRVVYSNKYRRFAVYGFLKVKIKIPTNIFSPVAVQQNGLNLYPVGEFETFITKAEYDYLVGVGADCTIIDGAWLHVDNKTYPFRKEIEKLVKLKQQYKEPGKELEYHTVKILLNSLYGKMVQLIKTKDYWKASSCWHPVYAAMITANVRIRISSMQQQFPSVVAVHTDSVISTKPLPLECSNTLGAFTKENEGPGVILGSGIYQIEDKTRFRGFSRTASLMKLIDTNSKTIKMPDVHAITWREVAFHNWDGEKINRFTKVEKTLRVNFDSKRIWLNDYKTFREVLTRNVMSSPIMAKSIRFLF
jgi:hypothetical protein